MVDLPEVFERGSFLFEEFPSSILYFLGLGVAAGVEGLAVFLGLLPKGRPTEPTGLVMAEMFYWMTKLILASLFAYSLSTSHYLFARFSARFRPLLPHLLRRKGIPPI